MAAERKTLTQLSVPICLETLFYMLSSVSDQAVGAVGTANTYIGVFIIMFGVISSGMVAVMSQNLFMFNWGVMGVAVATVISRIVNLIIVAGMGAVLIKAKQSPERILSRKILEQIVKIGFPSAFETALYNIAMTLIVRFIKEMISYIQQSFAGEISLREFGERFHLSEKYVSRYFKEHFHITLSKYVTYLRLEHAKQLLQNTDIPVTEVAMLSGYQNVSYFIRSFKKTYGVSPLKYRKNKSSTWT